LQSLGALAPRKGTLRRALRKGTLRAGAEQPPPPPPPPEYRGELDGPGTSAQRAAAQLALEAQVAALQAALEAQVDASKAEVAALKAKVGALEAERPQINWVQALLVGFAAVCAIVVGIQCRQQVREE
jgi:hypothetical protein